MNHICVIDATLGPSVTGQALDLWYVHAHAKCPFSKP